MLLLLVCGACLALASALAPPNIVVYMTEDMSPRTGFFGDSVASTPNLNKFAKSAVIFTNVYSVYAVCAPSRSSFTTGRYPFSYGAHNMRSDSFVSMPNGTKYLTVPPPEVKAFPEILRQHGYWTFSGPKCDMQFSDYFCLSAPESIWSSIGRDDMAFWRKREMGDSRPFMGQLGDQTTHESKIFPNSRVPDVLNRTEMIQRVPMPPFYKDTHTMRNDVASQYNNIAVMDGHFGMLMANLQKDSLLNDTIVIWMSDHGDGLPRGKRDVFDYGIHVPCVMWIPDEYQPTWWPKAGATVDRMVSFLDFAPSLLDIARVPKPADLPGFSLFGDEEGMRKDYVFGAKDRMDEAIDHVRYVRSKAGFKFIHNYLPQLPAGGRVSYRFQQLGAKELKECFENGTLNEVQSRWFLPRQPEEFYDLTKDPYELNNLINTTLPFYVQVLEELRTVLDTELKRVPDLGNTPEAVLAEKFWPGGVQPDTPEPVVSINTKKRLLTLRAPAEGSSLMYSLRGCGVDGEWYVYGSPVDISDCTSVSAKAQRYGWKRSAIVTKTLTDLVV